MMELTAEQEDYILEQAMEDYYDKKYRMKGGQNGNGTNTTYGA